MEIMSAKNINKEKIPTKLTEIGSGADVSEMIKYFLCYYELVEKNYEKEDFVGLSQNSQNSMKNVDKMAKITGIHPNLTRELILLHEEALMILQANQDLCPDCAETIDLDSFSSKDFKCQKANDVLENNPKLNIFS